MKAGDFSTSSYSSKLGRSDAYCSSQIFFMLFFLGFLAAVVLFMFRRKFLAESGNWENYSKAKRNMVLKGHIATHFNEPKLEQCLVLEVVKQKITVFNRNTVLTLTLPETLDLTFQVGNRYEIYVYPQNPARIKSAGLSDKDSCAKCALAKQGT